MIELTNLGEVISTDVLIIGGGISGLVASIKAKQNAAVDVLIVDKATPGYAGQGPLVSGAVRFLLTEEKLNEWLKWKVDIGGYLCNQEYAYSVAKDVYPLQVEMAEWGAPLAKDEKGSLVIPLSGRYFDGLFWPSPPAMMQFFKKKTCALGTKILKRTMVTDLLMEGGRVSGAVGFSIDSGQFYILKAKAIIVATGGCYYQWQELFTASSGESVNMAYHAGAEMRNAEFANTVGVATKEGNTWGRRTVHPYLVNVIGENLCDKYGIDKEVENWEEILPVMYKEVLAGRGPIYWQGTSERKWKVLPKYGETAIERLEMRRDQNIEVIPVPTLRQGAIKVDLHGRTAVPGLWASGDAALAGSSYTGANAPANIGGEPIPYAEVTGYRAGADAATSVSGASEPKVDLAEVSRLKEKIYTPLERKQGLSPRDAIYQVQEAVIPLKYMLFRTKERMQEALNIIEDLKQKLVTLQARDLHYLVKCHEAISMTFCAEITYKAALIRQESRGSHIREDFPERDDKNWLKWIVIKRKGEEMSMSTEPVPIGRYKIKPIEKA